MKKIIILVIVAIVVIGGLGYWFYQSETELKEVEKNTLDPKNCAYNVDGKNVTLKNGYSEEEIVHGTASKTTTQYFGNEVVADFNGDGIKDIAFLLTQSSGGSGIFYYAVAALSSKDGCNGTNAILLGDRIAPQANEFSNGEIIVNYAERKLGEPMTATPSVGVSKYFKVKGGSLVEVIKPSTSAQPSIASILPNPASVGSKITLTGASLNGFEGDKNLWIENSAGQKGIIYGERDESTTIIKFTLADKYCTADTSYSGAPCPSYITITPGTYKINTLPWGVMSNTVSFSVVTP